MSFENENVLQTKIKFSGSPGYNSTIINTLVSKDCSMLPNFADEDSMKLKSFDMPLLEDSIEFNIQLSESNHNELSNHPSVEDNEFSTKEMIKNGSNLIDPTNIVLEGSIVTPIAGECGRSFFGFQSLDSETMFFTNHATLINNIERQPETMEISDNCKYNVVEYPLTVTTEKCTVDHCTADNEDEISEFLVFRKTEPPTDTKLKYGCFVKLERMNLPVVREKRNTKTIDRYYPSPKKLKQSRTTGASNRSRKQRTSQRTNTTKVGIGKNINFRSGQGSKRNKSLYKTDESSCDDSPNRCNDQCKIVLRFVRPKDSSFYKCFKVSDISENKSDHKQDSYRTNVKQSVQRDLRSGKQIILPQSNAGTSNRSKDQRDTRNVHSKNVQPIQLQSRVDKRIVLPDLKAPRSDQSKDKSYTKLNVKPPVQPRPRGDERTMLPESKPDRSDRSKDQSYIKRNMKITNVKQLPQLHASDHERTMISKSKADRSDRSKDQSYIKRNMKITDVKQLPQLHASDHERTMISKSKTDRSDCSKGQSYTKRNMNPTNMKEPVQLHSKGSERIMLSERKADGLYRIKDQSHFNQDIYPTNVKHPVQLHSRGDIDKRIILPESRADNSPHLPKSEWNYNNMDEIMETNAAETIPKQSGVVENNKHPQFEKYMFDQPLDLTISKKQNLSNSLEEFATMEVEQSIVKQTIDQSLDKEKKNLKALFGTSSELSSDDDSTSLINSPQRDLQASNVINKSVVASRDSDDESSVCSELSIFAPSLSELSDSPRAKRSPPRIAKSQNNTFDLKKFRIPKIKRSPDESKKQLEAERRPNTKPLDTFGNGRNGDVVKTKKHKKVPVKEVTKPTTRPINISKAPESIRSTPNINETVEQMIPWKLVPLEDLSVGGSIHPLLDVSKSKTSQDNELVKTNNILQPKNVSNVDTVTIPINCNEVPSEDIFNTCLNKSKYSTKPLLTMSHAHRERTYILENYQIQVSNGNSTIRNVRYVPNDNVKKESVYGDTSGLLITNGSHMPTDLSLKVPTLPLFPVMQKSIDAKPALSALPQMLKPTPPVHEHRTQIQEQIPQVHEHSTQIQELASSLIPGIPKILNSSADFISQENRQLYRNKITKMFDGPCITFLANRQCDIQCQYKHILPSFDIIKKRLIGMPNDFIQFSYTDFISKNILTFEMYFPLICQLYGQRKLHSSFFQLIKDCEKFGKEEYFRFIVDGLLLCEFNKKDALLELIGSCEINSASDEIILQIIETDPQCFIEILKMYASRLTLNSNLVTKLLKQVADNREPELLRNCVDLLEQVGETLLNIDSNVLNTFCANVFALRDDTFSRRMLNIISSSIK